VPDVPSPPSSTYRLQLHRGFTFDDARRAARYLRRLGVGALYFSPYLRARPESTHGYDVSDHNTLNPVLGGEAAHAGLARELRRLDLGHVVDVVPNHMGIGEPSNSWWMDVLENGPSSIYADFFDVDWNPIKEELRDRVLLPVLGDQYGRVLENGELQLAFEGGAFSIRYYESRFPVSPRSYSRILEAALARLVDRAAGASPDDPVVELQSIATAARHLPTAHERDPGARTERHREKEVIKRRLAAVVEADRQIADAIDAVVVETNGRKGSPATFDRLDELLRVQCFRLSFWRVASEEINYRRFFDVNDLAAIRQEHPEVFAATHRLILRLVEEGNVTGLRIDHPDGLWDPARYFDRLQEAAGPTYVVVEKILAHGERLPADWRVAGTVGYEFLNALTGLFVDPAARRGLDRLYERVVGERIDFADLVYQSKKLIMQTALASEVNVLAHLLDRLSERNRRFRDFTLYALRHAVREVIACFPVYRTYVCETTSEPSPSDRADVESAIAAARRRNPALDPSVFVFLRDLLLLRLGDPDDLEGQELQRHFVMKFQQTTGPVAAKGVEDTAFYVYNRLVALNEVGGEPDRFGTAPEAFHALNAERQRDWPGGLSASSTHDTKRSEDVRARLAVLSELPGEWGRQVGEWSRRNRRKARQVGGQRAPDRNEEYLLYQTLVGAWPLGRPDSAFTARIVEYMRKATKEAKVNTSWINPNEAWDAALSGFVEAVLGDEDFLASFDPFARRVAHYGMYNSLAQTLLKLASPGVPDVYQGQELWDLSLVDPDNRRPVDFAARQRLLEAMLKRAPSPADLLAGWEDGRIKLWLTNRGLTLRRDRADLFARGDYRPLAASGACADSVVAFARRLDGRAVVAVAPRLLARLTDDPARPPIGAAWADTALDLGGAVPPGRYRDVLTDRRLTLRGRLALSELLAELPVALLEPGT
jgi:(1->4)-alpha-D-glucan 1-alpha-D-glucosylmutase